MDYNAVIPEFMVSNIEQSRSFYCYPHEFAVLDPDGYFLRFSE